MGVSGTQRATLRAWLRRHPQPKAVLADAQRIEVNTAAARWLPQLEQTIRSLEPTRVTCLDGSGAVLRAMTLPDASPGNDDDASCVSAPETTPSDTPLVTFARLLSDAYERSGKAQQPMLDSAMSFIERLTKRLTDTENELDRMRRAYARLLEETAQERADAIEASVTEQANGDGGTLVQALVAGALSAGAGAAPPAAGAPIPINKGKAK